MEKVFVTGGSGFIGSHLITKLLELGYSVTNYDLVPSTINPQATNIIGDIMDIEALYKAMRGHHIVCHLAAMVGVVACQIDEEKVHQINYSGAENVLKACEYNEISNVLFASSSEVYGEGKENAFLTENVKLSPLSPYGKAKMQAELLFEEYNRTKKAKSTAIRYCNVYGPRQRIDFVISIFIDKVLKNESLPVCEYGQQIRSYTFIDDAINGTIKALLRTTSDYQVFNICSDDTLKVIDVANRIITLNNAGTIKYLDYSAVNRMRKYEVINRIPSNRKAFELLDFNTEISFDEGLKRTFDYYKSMGMQQ
jgi:UDP-glucose 4-epimerase